jgi:hypothetical protein
MVEVTAHSIFGKMPLVEEQIELALAYEHLAKGAMWSDPRIIDSYYMETVLMPFSKEGRKKKAIREFKRSLEIMDRVM